MSAMTSQITDASILCSAVCSGADQRIHQSSASLAFVRGIHRWPVDSPHKGPVTRKIFPFDDVIMRRHQHNIFHFREAELILRVEDTLKRRNTNITTVMVFLCLLVVVCFCTHISNCANVIIEKKRKLCTEFTIDDHKAEEPPVNTNFNQTKFQCMRACARERNCSTFNFRWIDGTCVLLPLTSSCMAKNAAAGWVYVSLAQCDFILPWHSRTPAVEGTWDWITTQSNPKFNKDLIVLKDSFNFPRFAIRTFYKGMYLPGWSTEKIKFRSIDPLTSIRIRCSEGQFLSFPLGGNISYGWQWINAGNSVPSGAIVGGYGPEGEPLFIAQHKESGLPLTGYYNSLRAAGYFALNGFKQPVRMKILIKKSI